MSKFVSLKSITNKIGSGATPRGGQDVYKDSGISLIRSQNVLDFKFGYDGLAFIDEEQASKLEGVTVQNNDILLNITGDSIARVCIVPDDVLPARVNQHVSIIRCKDGISSKYVLYYLQHLKPYLLRLCRVGGTRNALTKEAIEKLKIRLRDDQFKIAAVLSTLDAKIELNNRINTELESLAKTIYDYWFVQFDFPNADGKPYKSSGGEMVYVDSGGCDRAIPKGWEVKKLSDIADITMGQSPDGSSYNEEQKGEIFFQGSTDFGWRFPTIRQYTTEPSRLAKKGDILLSVRAPVGTLNIADNDCCIGRGLASIRSKYGFDSYLFYVMQYFKIIFDHRNNSGTTFGSINKDDLHTLKLVYPSNDYLKKYDEIVSKYNSLILNNHRQNQQLTQLRDWLLTMLMNGQVSIK